MNETAKNRFRATFAGLAILVTAATTAVTHAVAAVPPPSTHVRVAKLFSTQDGTIQGVELEVVKVGDTPLILAGRTMKVTDRGGNVRAFTLAGSVDGAASRPTLLVLASAWLDDMSVSDGWGPHADLAMPRYFLPTDGGTLSIEGMDEIAFGRLPGDGRSALARDGTTVPAHFKLGRVRCPLCRGERVPPPGVGSLFHDRPDRRGEIARIGCDIR